MSETLVLDAVWGICFRSQPTFPVFFVIGVIAREEGHLGVALEREDVCANAIEKPAVM